MLPWCCMSNKLGCFTLEKRSSFWELSPRKMLKVSPDREGERRLRRWRPQRIGTEMNSTSLFASLQLEVSIFGYYKYLFFVVIAKLITCESAFENCYKMKTSYLHLLWFFCTKVISQTQSFTCLIAARKIGA